MKENKSNKLAAMIMAGIAGVSLVGLTGCTINIGTGGSDSNSNPTSKVQEVKKTKTYSVSGYSLELPESYYVEYKDTALRVSSSASNPTWMAQIQTISGTSYAAINSNKVTVQNRLASSGLKFDKTETKTIDGINWILIEGEYSGYKYIYGYGEATSNSVFYLALGGTSGSYDFVRFNELAGYIAKAKQSSSTSSSTGFSLDNIPGLNDTGVSENTTNTATSN